MHAVLAFRFALGDNTFGQLGLGVKDMNVEVPTAVETLSTTKIVEAACGDRHTIFIDGEVRCRMPFGRVTLPMLGCLLDLWK
jgi:hypothetical protein